MTFYNNIEPEIRLFLSVDEITFNSLPESVRPIVYQDAKSKWMKEGEPRLDSMRYPVDQSNYNQRLSYMEMDEMTDYYYHYTIIKSTVGIDTYKFKLKSSIIKPTPWEFINIAVHQSNKLNATNAAVSYIDSNDFVQTLCFSNKDLQNHTVEELFNLMKEGSDQWREDSLYGGSDYIKNAYRTLRLYVNQLSIIVSHTRGGYGKMIADYYDTLGLENNEDDCLIQCFLYIYQQEYPNGEIPSIVELRKQLIKEGKLGLENVPLLENLLKINVDIVKDYHDVDIDYICPVIKNLARPPPYTEYKAIVKKDKEIFIYGNGRNKWKLLHKDEHYDVVTRSYSAKECLCPHTGELLPGRKPFGKKTLRRKIIEKYYIDSENLTQDGGDSDNEEDRDVYYYFFDYETVFEPDTMEIIPYACAIVKCDNEFNIMEEKCYIGMQCDIELSFYLSKEKPNKHSEIKYLIGYNNSRFDNFILLKSALKNDDYIGHTRFAGNTIISANVNDFKVRDLCRILNMPLDKACESFKIKLPKLTGAVQHHEVQLFYMNNKGRFHEYLIDYSEIIKEYVTRDCVCLVQLYKDTRKTMLDLINLDIKDHYTLAGMSYAAFKSISDVSQLPVLDNSYTFYDKMVREAIIGGRSQMNFSENKEGNMYAIDCVSLYPYVMLNRHFPIGYPNRTESYVSGKIGVYNVKVIRQPHERLNSIPLRDETGKLNWNHKGEIECTLCSVDIECLERYGGVIEIKDGIYWENTSNNLFDQYFKPLIEEKKKQDKWKEEGDERYNPAVREGTKLDMNALSGKLAQRLYTIVTEIIRNAGDVDRFYNKTIPGTQTFVPFGSKFIAQGRKEAMPTTPCIYGVLIYAYAREHMYESVLQHLKPEELYGMDTDSAFITKECLMRIPKYLMGNDFGQFKVELKDCNGIFIAPKCYCFYKEDKIMKARFKGVKIEKDVECHDDYKEENPIELYEYYHTKDEKVGLDTFKKLLKDKQCKIICCNINKMVVTTSGNNALYLSNHTFIKEVIVEDSLTIKSIGNDIIIDE